MAELFILLLGAVGFIAIGAAGSWWYCRRSDFSHAFRTGYGRGYAAAKADTAYRMQLATKQRRGGEAA